MILLLALALGLPAGLAWAHLQNRSYEAPPIQFIWLVFVAFIPQLLFAYLPTTRHFFADWISEISLMASLALFAAFVWLNRQLPGMPIVMIGLALNLLVIVANGGWMPIEPQTASQLVGKDILQVISPGSRFGQKDMLLLPQQIHFSFLADRFLLPGWFPYQSAFSLGDILIASGIFWLVLRPTASANQIQYPNGVEIS